MDLQRLLAVARTHQLADLLLRNVRILNVFNGEIEAADLAIAEGRIAGIGRGYTAVNEMDLAGAFVAPGLIDAHVHIESSLCVPSEFARAVVPRGVTTVITDPHEIANVCGTVGVDYMLDASRGLPLDVRVMAPSCVPATDLGSAGAALSTDDLTFLRDRVHGLAEVMNFPGVINGHDAMLGKVAAFNDRPVDGHCPGVVGAALNAYVAAGIGSDHESISLSEAQEKLARGLYVLIREASNARNLEALLPLVTPNTNRRICFCTDDRQPADLLGDGGIDHMVRVAIASGIAPVDAFRLATLNTAEWFRLSDRGAIGPGKRADLIVFDDLSAPRAKLVFAQGKLVARDGSLIDEARHARPEPQSDVAGRCNIDWSRVHFRIPAQSNRVRVIGSIEGQLVTQPRVCNLPSNDGLLQADPAQDVLKMAVIERHAATGNMGVGFIHGFGLKRGAIAGTVAHDHHNLVVIGANDDSMMSAARAVAEMGGGLVVVDGSQIVARLPLNIAGLMSDQPIERVRDAYATLLSAARALGSPMKDPFMAMSFMALEVIPSLKLTDQGLIDVEQFKIVSLYA